MNFYIKTWPDDTATLMTDNGQVLWSFHCLNVAVSAAREWYAMNEDKIGHIDSLKEGEIYSFMDAGNLLKVSVLFPDIAWGFHAAAKQTPPLCRSNYLIFHP